MAWDHFCVDQGRLVLMQSDENSQSARGSVPGQVSRGDSESAQSQPIIKLAGNKPCNTERGPTAFCKKDDTPVMTHRLGTQGTALWLYL